MVSSGPKIGKYSGHDEAEEQSSGVTESSTNLKWARRRGLAATSTIFGVLSLLWLLSYIPGLPTNLKPWQKLPRAWTKLKQEVVWQPCGKGFDCATISVPFDYRNASDSRRMNIAVTRLWVANMRTR